MKKSFHLLLFFILLISVSVQAQIGNEIKNYVDSTELMVNNGRRMLAQKITEGNFDKAREVYEYLRSETKDKKQTAFNYTEELYLDFLFANWDQWIEKAANFSKYASRTTYPNMFGINDLLYSEISKKAEFNASLLPTLNLDPEAQRVMEIYNYFLKTGIRDDAYTTMVKSFHKDYKNSRFNPFFERYLPSPVVKGAMAISMGTAGIFPTGKLADRFSSVQGFNMALDLNFGKVYASLNMQGSPIKLTVPFNATDSETTWEFTKGEKFQYFQGGVSLGYFVTRNNRFHLAPFVFIGGAELQSNRFDSKDDDKEFDIVNSFCFGPGLHTEVKLKQFKSNYTYAYGAPGGGSYISLKLDGGYNIMTQYNFDQFKGNIAYFNFSFVYGIGFF